MTGGKPFQSKLNPHFALIRELRTRRTPYPEIARILREEHGLSVGPTTIFDFVKVRSKKRDVYAISDDPAAQPTITSRKPSTDARAKTTPSKNTAPASRRPRAATHRKPHAR